MHLTQQKYKLTVQLQLSKIPTQMQVAGSIMDTPDKGERIEFHLEAGDVLVLYVRIAS